MQQNKNFPSLPPEMAHQHHDSIAEVHDNWKDRSVDDIERWAPDSQMHRLHSGQSIRYSEITPSTRGYDTDDTGLLILSHAAKWDLKSAAYAGIVHDLVVPNGRLIVLPNNNIGQRSYEFTKEEQQKVASGDLSPLSEQQIALCRDLGITALKLLLGHSFGASAGASFGAKSGGDIELSATALSEAPNTIPASERGGIKLRWDFAQEKKHISPAVEDIGIPAASELSRTRGGLDWPKLQYDLLKYSLGGNLIPANQVINTFFLGNSFSDDTEKFVAQHPETNLLLASAISSKISSLGAHAALVDKIARSYGSARTVDHIIYEGTHTTATNPFVLGLLGKQAMELHAKTLVSKQVT